MDVPCERTVLLISDLPDQSRELARRLDSVCACRAIGLHEQASIAAPISAVVTDVDLHRPAAIERLRHLLSQPCAATAPIVAILRENSHIERVQAAALGASFLFPANASISDISAALALAARSTAPPAQPAASMTPGENIEQTRLRFEAMFDAVARGELIRKTDVENATASVKAAVAEGGIRQWLETVWKYDDATYQHCLLVTGLAAAFGNSLRFGGGDYECLIRGALLHDVGKAKIPLAILNKPGALTREELAIMRTHAAVGYELLRAQGDYDPELLEVVLRHHEMLDGSGYPDGLAGPQIRDLVRLVTICDIYAALIERRAYKPPMEAALAYNKLQEMEGKLEGALVRAFAPVAEKSAAPALAKSA